MSGVQGGTAPYNQIRLLADVLEGEVCKILSEGGFTVGEYNAVMTFMKAVKEFRGDGQRADTRRMRRRDASRHS